jgi:hypothetical protein
MSAVEARVASRIWKVPLIRIEQIVSSHLGPGRVRGNEQRQCFSRQVSMYLAWRVGGWSTTRIGRFYNGRHHTTVLHAVSKIERLRRVDDAVDALLDVLTGTLASEIETPVPVPAKANWQDRFVDALAERILQRLYLIAERQATALMATLDQSGMSVSQKGPIADSGAGDRCASPV